MDTGSSGVPEFVDRLEGVLREAGAELQEIIITHWHSDHVGGLADIRRRLGGEPSAAGGPGGGGEGRVGGGRVDIVAPAAGWTAWRWRGPSGWWMGGRGRMDDVASVAGRRMNRVRMDDVAGVVDGRVNSVV